MNQISVIDERLIHLTLSSFRNKPTPPPPLPPHGVPLQPKPQQVEDYRPPVPPHRNIGVTSSLEGTPPRKHHHHHHHRNSKHQDNKHHHRAASDYGWAVSTVQDEDLVMTASQEPLKSVFEFDDEPPKEEKKEEVKMRSKPAKNDDDNVQFVQYPKSPNSNANG
jgi:transmembrane protein 132